MLHLETVKQINFVCQMNIHFEIDLENCFYSQMSNLICLIKPGWIFCYYVGYSSLVLKFVRNIGFVLCFCDPYIFFNGKR